MKAKKFYLTFLLQHIYLPVLLIIATYRLQQLFFFSLSSNMLSFFNQDERKTLPIYKFRDELLKAVDEYQVCITSNLQQINCSCFAQLPFHTSSQFLTCEWYNYVHNVVLNLLGICFLLVGYCHSGRNWLW